MRASHEICTYTLWPKCIVFNGNPVGRVQHVDMLKDVNAKLNPGLPWKISVQQEVSFKQQIEFKFKEETSKFLHMEHSFVRCWELDTAESRSEIAGKL